MIMKTYMKVLEVFNTENGPCVLYSYIAIYYYFIVIITHVLMPN